MFALNRAFLLIAPKLAKNVIYKVVLPQVWHHIDRILHYIEKDSYSIPWTKYNKHDWVICVDLRICGF